MYVPVFDAMYSVHLLVGHKSVSVVSIVSSDLSIWMLHFFNGLWDMSGVLPVKFGIPFHRNRREAPIALANMLFYATIYDVTNGKWLLVSLKHGKVGGGVKFP
eukprot:GHVS01083368.1.p1 GENE.GHVS01083368.1~~GHVS01083368.1.p1  ORF type:complete len:103 (+),score=1.31 GHVS01083368.1:523-831(+)